MRSLNLSSHQTPDWLGQQGGKGLDWAGKQREQVINWGGDALNWAGRQGEELLRPVDDLLTGRNLEMAGVPRGAKPNINAPTPKPRPETPTSAPRPGETAPAKPSVVEETTPTNLPSSRSPDVDTPNGRTPDVETPNGGTPQVDAPNVRTPEVETPNARTPEVETPNARTPEVDTPNPTKVEPEPPAPRNADGTANIEQEVGEAGLRGADNAAGAGRVADDPEAMNVLADTAPKQRLSELSSKELSGELDVVEDLPRKQINEPPYVEEVELPNGHEWKRQQDGTWCRFSEPKGDNCLPPNAQELVDTVNKDAQDILAGKLNAGVLNTLLSKADALNVVLNYGDDAVELVARYGDDAINALPNLAKEFSPEQLKILVENIKSGRVTGDVSDALHRVAVGGTNTIGAIGELNGFNRAIERGYDRVEVIKPPSGKGAPQRVKSPEAKTFKGVEEFRLEQKTATEPPKFNQWKKHFDNANKQIKGSGFPGDIQFDFRNVDITTGELNNQAQMERFMADRMREDRARSINYFEILWKQPDGTVMKTYRRRNVDGKVTEVITEAL